MDVLPDSSTTQGAAKWLQKVVTFDPAVRDNLLASVFLILVVLAARWIVMKVVRRRSDDIKTHYQWRKISSYVTTILIFFLVGRIWFEGVQSLGTILGLLSAGVAIALRDPIVNLAGWLFIVWRKPFEVGDRIQIGNDRGDVIDLRIFQFTLMEIGNWVDADQSTGRVIHVPNQFVFTRMQANYSKGFQYIWNELGVLVTFESDWKLAERLLTRIVNEQAEHLTESAAEGVRRAARKFMITYSTLTPKVYVSVKDSGVMLTLRYLCNPRGRRGSEEKIWKEVLSVFAEHATIDFAYPTIRAYRNEIEGKEGTKPPSMHGDGDGEPLPGP